MKNKKTCFAWILVFCVVLSSFAGCVAEKDSGAFSGESTNDMPESSLNDRIVFSETIEEQNSLQAYHAQIEGFGNMDYYLFVPEQTRDLMPLVVYLHSASGKGDDLSRLTEMDSFPKYLNTGEMGKVEAFVLIPLLPASEKGWAENGKAVSDLIGEIMVSYPIDPGNVSLTGHSIGGTGTWNIAAEYPSLFARIAPLSGGVRVNDRNITALKEVSVWAFVGSEDTVISPNSSKQMVSELKKAQGDAKITVHSGASHEEVPRLTYLDGSLGVLNWLIGASLVQGSVEWTASVSLTASQTGSDEMNMYKNSDFIEKEQPELTEETKRLISRYQKDPGLENYLSLREEVIRNYDAVLARKEAKLAELREETAGKVGGEAKVAEMEEIVQEMYLTYWDRINSSMLRFSDERLLKWKIADAAKYEYIPVMGAGESVYVKRTPVTNEEYALFLRETGYIPPAEWIGGIYPAGEEKYPVTGVSYSDAQAYCAYLTERDGANRYRLPSESEWELAAGHMPKDADFNCGVNDGPVSVETYASVTRGAHGAVDFWGNVWEWTDTVRASSEEGDSLAVKGGSWKSPRTDCRTEYRGEERNEAGVYDDVGFRVIRLLRGVEPARKASLSTLAAPQVKAFEKDSGKIELFWDKVENAVEYQIFAYSRETGLFRMLDRTGENSFLITSSSEESGFVVQALSYTAFSDNVSPENAVYPVGEEISPVPEVSPSPKKNKILYYGILCLAVLLLLIVVVLLVWNHSRKNKGKPI